MINFSEYELKAKLMIDMTICTVLSRHPTDENVSALSYKVGRAIAFLTHLSPYVFDKYI
jgi:hypothetical protein